MTPSGADAWRMSSPRRHFTHFTLAEREILRGMHTRKSSCIEIARVVGKSRTSVWRELKRNTNEGEFYYERHANSRMLRRRAVAKESARIIDNDLAFEARIENMTRDQHLSPEQVAGHLARVGDLKRVCHKTIYRWAHRKWPARKTFLRFKGRTRRPYGTYKRAWQADKRHISTRPLVVEKRVRAGDWEADLVHGSQNDSRHCALTLVDRACGITVLWKVSTLHSYPMAHIMALALKGLPVKTITCDNGSEFGYHKLVEKKLGCQVYFADPGHPEQRGSNENLNGLIREFLPKGKSLVNVTQLELTEIAALLNSRPRKRFGYKTPRIVFAEMTGLSPYFIR
jgi:IS30 family transposase